MKIYLFLSLLCLSTPFIQCSQRGDHRTAIPAISANSAIDTLTVSVQELLRRDFNSTLVCNGRLEAAGKASLQFAVSGMVCQVLVHEGESVRQNDVIALIDDTNARTQLKSAQLGYSQSLMALQDRLSDMDLTLADTLALSYEQKNALFLSTGFSQAQLSLSVARDQLEFCILRAPFQGRIADLNGKEYQYIQGEFCKLVNDSLFDVCFQVLESELHGVRVGQSVTVVPYSDSEVRIDGRIVSVNPLVADNGMVNVRARIKGNDGLIDGMAVQVSIITPYANSFVVPRSAVRITDGRSLLFTYSKGKSVWNYVEIVRANDREYAVEPDLRRNSPLKQGDLVIVSGIDNLTDGSPVRIRE